jgi:ketosteroid isomerase-like protein
MSEENVEVVRRAYDVWNAFMRGELSSETVLNAADPRVEAQWHGVDWKMPDFPQQVRSAPRVVEVWEQVRSAMADVTREPLEFIAVPDDRVLVPTRMTARGRESGIPVEEDFFQLWTVRDGNVRKVESFRRRADALEAAGMSE